MLLHAMFRLPLILSVELLVLIAALFLMVYIAKQQVSKWYTYGAAAIMVVVLLMMVCTCCCACCMRHCEQGGPGCERMEEGMGPHRMMMKRMIMEGPGFGHRKEMGSCCNEEMECCKKMESSCEEKCEMKGEDCCKKGMNKGHCDKPEEEKEIKK